MPRTPKNYDGIAPPAKTLREVLPEVLGRIQRPDGVGGCQVLEVWPDVIGPKMASMTKAVSFERGALIVLVRSASLYSVLCQHEKPRLLRLLQERFSKNVVRELVFRIG